MPKSKGVDGVEASLVGDDEDDVGLHVDILMKSRKNRLLKSSRIVDKCSHLAMLLFHSGVTKVIISIQTQPELTNALRENGDVDVVSSNILKLIGRHEGTLQPTFPNATDSEFATHFFVEISDPAEAESLAGELMAVKGIAAAYVKPEGEPPSF